MPSKSEKQKRLMRAAAHNKEFADRVGIPQEVAREFVEADKNQKKEEQRRQDKSNK